MNNLNPEQDAAIAHWSTIRDGEQYSWIWLFPGLKEAVAVRALIHFLPDDANRALIEGTILRESYVQIVPRQWLLEDWHLTENGIHEVWFGFDYLRFKEVWELKACAQVFSVDEFLEHLKRGHDF
jgi:hypothetical protein